MRLAAPIAALLLLGPAQAAAQEWPRMPLIHLSAGDTLVVAVPGSVYAPGSHLRITFLRTGAAAPSSAFHDAPDSMAVATSRDGRGPWEDIGGLRLPPFPTAWHLDDFDRNGRTDLFLEWVTGGNGAASSGGAIYEIGVGDDGAWHLRPMLYSDTSVVPMDMDSDGLWEFGIADEYWGLASAHAWAARFLSRVYEPDVVDGGYDLASRAFSDALSRLCRPAALRFAQERDNYLESPTLDRARDLAAAFGEMIAWSIAGLDGSALERLIDSERMLLERLIDELALPIGSVDALKRDALDRLARIGDAQGRPPPLERLRGR